MTERGVFAIDRGIFTDPDFAAEPFTEREAFMWLVSEAAWKDRLVRASAGKVQLKRGEICHSVRFMAEAWRWSKSRVDRFLKRLEKYGTLRSEKRDSIQIYFLSNYSKFQRVGLPERDSSGTAAGQQRDSSGTNYKQENIKTPSDEGVERADRAPPKKRAENRKEVEKAITDQVSLPEGLASEIVDYRNRIKKPLSVRAARSIGKHLAQCPDPEDGVEVWFRRGWVGFDIDWYRRHQSQGNGPGPPSLDAEPAFLAGTFQRRKQREQRERDARFAIPDGTRPGAVVELAAEEKFWKRG